MSDDDSLQDGVPDRAVGIDEMSQLVMRLLGETLPVMVEQAIIRHMESIEQVSGVGTVSVAALALESRGGYVSLQELLVDPGAKAAADR